MKLAFCLFKYFSFGGLQRDFTAIVRECLSRGHSVHIFAMEWHGEIPSDFKVTLLPVRGWSNHRRCHSFAKAFGQELLQQEFDVVVGFNKMPYLDIYYAADPCYEAKARTLRSPFYRWGTRYHSYAQLEQSVFGKGATTKIFSIAERQQSDIVKYYGLSPDRFCLLPPWIQQDRIPTQNAAQIRADYRQQFQVADENYCLLMVGSGFKTKGLDRALLAVAALPPSLKERVRFLVIGHDNPQPFLRLAKRLGIDNQTQILGGRPDIPQFLLAADLLIHPAYNESGGIILLEAMVAGLPVLATAVCGYSTYVKEAGAGEIVPEPFSQAYFNDLLATMLTSSQKEQWRHNGVHYEKLKHFFGMPAMVTDKIEAWAQEIICLRNPDVFLKLHADINEKWQSEDRFSEIMSLDGKVYREIARRKTLRFEHNNQYYFAKLHYGVGWLEIFKNLLQLRVPVVGASNEWLAIEKFSQLKINTLRMVGYGWKGRNPARRQSFILTQALPPSQSLEDVCRDWPTSKPSFALKQCLLEQIAVIARKLHQNGVNHRDFYICHFLLNSAQDLLPTDTKADIENKVTLFLIDLHRVQLRKTTPKRWVVKDIGSLYFSAMDIGLTGRDIFRFLKIYHNKPLRQILENDLIFLHKVHKRGVALYYKANHCAPSLPREVMA